MIRTALACLLLLHVPSARAELLASGWISSAFLPQGQIQVLDKAHMLLSSRLGDPDER